MARAGDIREHMEVIGADGVHVGTVDKVEGDRIKLTKADAGQGSHQGHHHFLPIGLVADVEGGKVRLSATGANALTFREEQDSGSTAPATDRSHTRQHTAPQNESSGSHVSWGAIALGAGAVATAASAALFLRSKKSETNDFELQLQTDENLRLISSSKVEGTAVVGRNGERLGRVENFMVDKYTGRVAYAVLSFGGTFGLGESLFPLPWAYLTYDVSKDGYVLNLTKDQLAEVPRFEPSDAPEFSLDYRRNLGEAYGRHR